MLPLAFLLAIAPAQACAGPTASLPAALAGWRETGGPATIGRAFMVAGRDPTSVRGLRASSIARPGLAALVPFEIDRAGTYRIALGSAAWVDVMAGGRALPSIAHAHGPRCSGIRKIVDFRLAPGRYSLHLSALKEPTLKVLITPA